MKKKVDIHLFAINTEELKMDFNSSNIVNLLPQNEIEKLKKKKHKDQLNSLVGYLIISGYLCRFAGLSREKIEFQRNQWGKPFLKKDLNWNGSFNISHSSNWVICGISNSRILGVDIEKEVPTSVDFLEYCFTEKEINQKSKSNNIFEAIKYWTLKESYLKAIGTGLRRDLKSIEIMMENESFQLYDAFKGENEKYFFRNFLWEEEYHLSICSNQQFLLSNVKIIQLEEVLNWFN